MLFAPSFIAAFAGMIATGLAVQAPASLVDGSYEFTDDGEWFLLDRALDQRSLAHAPRQAQCNPAVSNPDPRAIFTASRTGCYESGGNDYDLEQAAALLGRFCDECNTVQNGRHRAEISFGNVFYTCARGQDLPCSSNSVYFALDTIEGACAQGYGYADDTGSGLSYGTTFTGSGISFCGQGSDA